MKFDIVLAGVGGQGVLSVSAVIASAALAAGLQVKQSETHGMAQRGGAVSAHLRLSDRQIASDLVPLGSASLLLSMEPLESLRYLTYLSPHGTIITANAAFTNITDYPPLPEVFEAIRRAATAVFVDAEALARQAGSVRAVNMVMVGAASTVLPIDPTHIEQQIQQRFASKGERVVDMNLHSFRAGRQAGHA